MDSHPFHSVRLGPMLPWRLTRAERTGAFLAAVFLAGAFLAGAFLPKVALTLREAMAAMVTGVCA